MSDSDLCSASPGPNAQRVDRFCYDFYSDGSATRLKSTGPLATSILWIVFIVLGGLAALGIAALFDADGNTWLWVSTVVTIALGLAALVWAIVRTGKGSGRQVTRLGRKIFTSQDENFDICAHPRLWYGQPRFTVNSTSSSTPQPRPLPPTPQQPWQYRDGGAISDAAGHYQQLN